ncbi:uncharacterized protein CBL_08547 [Carabus blaptoides fortunei]
MSWSREQVQYLIDLYKCKPCLYAVKTVNYKNKHARNAAWNEIYTSLKDVRPATTINEIKNKINSLRTNFSAEYRKIIKSKNSGAGTDELYTTSLWYFDELYFILDLINARKSYDSITDSADVIEEDIYVDLPIFSEEVCVLSPTNSENHLNDNFESGESVSLPSTTDTPISSKRRSQSSIASVPIKKTKKSDNTDHLLKSASTTMDKIVEVMINKENPAINNKDSIRFFSDFVDSRLRLLKNTKIQNDVMEKITILLFDGFRKESETI